jgi:hypothetical protein
MPNAPQSEAAQSLLEYFDSSRSRSEPSDCGMRGSIQSIEGWARHAGLDARCHANVRRREAGHAPGQPRRDGVACPAPPSKVLAGELPDGRSERPSSSLAVSRNDTARPAGSQARLSIHGHREHRTCSLVAACEKRDRGSSAASLPSAEPVRIPGRWRPLRWPGRA